MSDLNFDAAMRRYFLRSGGGIGTVIDVGASDGHWAARAVKWFSRARFHMIEANEVHEPGLRDLAQRTAGFSCVVAAAGPSVGNGHLWLSPDPFGGTVMESALPGYTRAVPQTTIDHEVERLGLPGPYFIKFDTHGFERDILAGAQRTLSQTRLIQMEMYNFEYRPGIGMHRTIGHLHDLGFRCSDIFDPMWRPNDHAFWQIDMLFEPQSAHVFASDDFAASMPRHDVAVPA